jgi:hypothetical protein
MKKVESVLHVLMGFFCGLVGLHLLLTWREYRQLPPENNRYPLAFLLKSNHRSKTSSMAYFHSCPDQKTPENWGEYWSKVRVMDTLQDSMEYVIGYTAATVTHLAIIVWLLTLSS